MARSPAQDISRRRSAATAAKTSTACLSMDAQPARRDKAGITRRQRSSRRVFTLRSRRVASCQRAPQGTSVSIRQRHTGLGPTDTFLQLECPPGIGVVVSGGDGQGTSRAKDEQFAQVSTAALGDSTEPLRSA